MKRARSSPEWKAFLSKVHAKGFELYTRIGDPVIIHKEYTPINRDTVWFVFFMRGRKPTKKQETGLNILSRLGLKTYFYVPDAEISPK